MANVTSITNDAVQRYFKALGYYGYKSYSEVNRLLTLIAIQELLDYDFRGLVSEADYRLIDNALHCLYGSTCLIPWVNYCKGDMNIKYIGSMSELAYRLKQKIEDGKTIDERVADLEHKSVTGRLDIVKEVTDP